jgi:hypothetical protein
MNRKGHSQKWLTVSDLFCARFVVFMQIFKTGFLISVQPRKVKYTEGREVAAET